MKRLSQTQIIKLILMARKAYEHAGSRAAEPLPDFNTWRHEQVLIACGRPGLRDAENKHYSAIASRFASLAGEEGQAFEHQLRDQTNERRQLEWSLVRELERAALPQSFAEAISRDRWGGHVSDLTVEQLKMCLMTVKARVRSKLRKDQEAVAA